MTGLLVAAGAAVGAVLRYLAAHHFDGRWPWGTLVVNTAGSFLLGAFSAMLLTGSAMAGLGVGFCGGLTTYSAFAVQTATRGPRLGAAYAATTILLALVACAAGFALYA